MKIIATFTTFPQRAEKCQITVDSILSQSMPPDEIVCNLYLQEFDALPEWMQDYQNAGKLIINPTEYNFQAYKKLMPTLDVYGKSDTDTLFFGFDDDVLYPEDIIQKGVETFLQNGCRHPVSVFHKPHFGSRYHIHGQAFWLTYDMVYPAMKTIFYEYVRNPWEEYKFAEDALTTYACYANGYDPIPCNGVDWTNDWYGRNLYTGGISTRSKQYYSDLHRFQREMKSFVERRFNIEKLY